MQHEKNKKMVREFYKTRIFHDINGTQGFTGPSENASVRLPGAHFILDHAYAETPREEPKDKVRDAMAADRWLSAAQPFPGAGLDLATPKTEDVEHAPPGVPMFLAHAIRPSGGADDGTMWYDPDDEMIALSTKMWQISELNAMMSGHNPLVTSDPASLMPLAGTPSQHMYSQAPAVQTPSQQLAQAPQSTQGMFMSPYPPQFQDGHMNTTQQYMQHHGFG
jgi:hypothetical protein